MNEKDLLKTYCSYSRERMMETVETEVGKNLTCILEIGLRA